jgi:hypothetical protein
MLSAVRFPKQYPSRYDPDLNFHQNKPAAKAAHIPREAPVTIAVRFMVSLIPCHLRKHDFVATQLMRAHGVVNSPIAPSDTTVGATPGDDI